MFIEQVIPYTTKEGNEYLIKFSEFKPESLPICIGIKVIDITLYQVKKVKQNSHELSTVGKFLRPLIPFLRIGFKNQAIKKSGCNAAMAYTLENAVTGIYPAYEIDYANVLVSEGLLTEALNPSAVSSTAGKIEFTWEDNSDDTYAESTDKAMLVVYNLVKKRAVTVVGGNTRTGGTQTIMLPASFSGDEVQCFIGFQNGNQSVMSNSQFVIGLIVL